MNTEWNGEGLPPIGMPCEYYWASDDSWREGTCVAHFDGRAVICDRDDEDCAERLDAHHVRPIRTPEQIAAEVREKAVDGMVTVWKRTMGRFAQEERGLAEMLYDAGYRKVTP